MIAITGGAQTAVGGVTRSRVAAAAICAGVRGGEMLDQAFDRRTSELDARDRRWLRELVYGMLRRRGAIDALLSARVRGGIARLDADLLDLLRLGVHQLAYMGSVPAYAAIAQTVELAKLRHGIGASKLTNAVLRRTDREGADLTAILPADPVESLAIRESHPAWLVARWVARWGVDATAALLARNNTEAPLIVRPYGVVREQLEAALEESGVEVSDAPLLHDSIQLSGPVTLTELGAFRKGLFFVQDPASTLVAHYSGVPVGSRIADLCSAPGGKALELARAARYVIAADRSAQRLGRVLDNIQRVDVRNVLALVADARHPAIRPADAVLLDVPCTGTGTFRRHPDARWRLRASDLAVMASLQSAMLKAASEAVRPDGLLIYSTCSLEPEENEEQVEKFLESHPHFTLEAPPAGAVPEAALDGGLLRVLPHVHETDGAFAARFRRTS